MRFLQSYFFGEGLSGFIPAIAGIIQGVGKIACNGTIAEEIPPLYDVEGFFIILAVLCFISLLAFWLISTFCQAYFIKGTGFLLQL